MKQDARIYVAGSDTLVGGAILRAVKRLGYSNIIGGPDEKLDLTRWATEELRKIKGMEIVAEPQLSLVAFRLSKHDNRNLLERINRRKRVMLTGTMLGTEFVIRICVVSHRTHMDRMQMCIEDIRAAVAEVT